jgi:serine/threonine-protein kinase
MAARFRHEIKLARKVSHRNVCRIHEYGEDGGLAYISMELIDGKNVREFLAERSLSAEEALELSIQVAEGLQAVHEHGIVHRDFKASNIMIDRHGIVKLMDFGIAKQASAESTGFTGSGVVGTPEYMSPEQASGARVDLRSDLYSLGCVVYETFTGAPPFRGATPLETMRLHEHQPPPLEDAAIPEPVRAVLRRALAKEPAQRFASPADFAEALRQARAQLGITGERRPLRLDSRAFAPPRPGTPTRTVVASPSLERPAAGRRRALRLALAGGLALAVGAIALRARTPPEASVAESPTLRSPAAESPSPRPIPEASAPVPGANESQRGAPLEAPRETPRPAPREQPAAPAAVEPTAAPAAREPPPVTLETPSPEPTPSGTLLLLIVPESEVTIDGRSIGKVSNQELALPVGPHAVLILHPDYKPLPRKITIQSGVSTRVVVDLNEKGIRKQP